MYPEKFIFDVAGFPKVLAKDLISNLEKQALQFQPTICLDEKVIEIRRDNETLQIYTPKGVHQSKAIVITTGMGAFSPRKLGNPKIEAFEGKGLMYFAQDFEQFRDKNVLIVGGGDSATDWTISLEPIAQSVTLIHRRDRFRAHESSVEQIMNNPRINVRTFHELEQLIGDDHVCRAVIFNNKNHSKDEIPIDYCILALGFSPNSDAYSEWGLETDNDLIIARNFMMETNIPGVYTAGDIATYPGKAKLIATGFGEAANAVNAAFLRINPDAKLDPGHSSSRKDLA